VIANTAYFSSTLEKGQGSAAFSVVCINARTVQNANDDGPGSLRQAIARVCPNGRIDFAGDYAIYLNRTLSLNKRLTMTAAGTHYHQRGYEQVGSRNVRCSTSMPGGCHPHPPSFVSGTASQGGASTMR
jgi:hypothetical protein